MEVQLREMSEEAFQIFLEKSIYDYANDLAKSFHITMDKALIQAQGGTTERIRICCFKRDGTRCWEKWLQGKHSIC